MIQRALPSVPELGSSVQLVGAIGRLCSHNFLTRYSGSTDKFLGVHPLVHLVMQRWAQDYNSADGAYGCSVNLTVLRG